MELKDITAMLEMIRMAYPRYSRELTRDEKAIQIEMWQSQFRDDNPVLVRQALENHIRTSEFPPSIAEIRRGINVLTMPSKGELWDTLMQAAAQSITTAYSYENSDNAFVTTKSGKYEAFDSLPKVLQRYVTSPNGLQDFYYEQKDSPMRAKDKFMRQIESYNNDAEHEELRRRAGNTIGLASLSRQLTGNAVE